MCIVKTLILITCPAQHIQRHITHTKKKLACCTHGIYINLVFSLMYTLNKQFTWATTTVWRAKGEVNVLLAVQADDVTGDVHHLLPDSAHKTLLFSIRTMQSTGYHKAWQCNRNKPPHFTHNWPYWGHFFYPKHASLLNLNSCTQHTSCWQHCQNASNVILSSARDDLWVAP